MNEAFKYGRQGERPIVQRPAQCDRSCIHYNGCSYPKTCPVVKHPRKRAYEPLMGFEANK